ncbi:MAG: hypothetical protein WCT03_03775 [Candidatus Obscuribacterales bacterium]|jgi:hypothetical protein
MHTSQSIIYSAYSISVFFISLSLATLIGSAICLLLQLHFSASIRRLSHLMGSAVAKNRSVDATYQKFDKRRNLTCLGVICLWAGCAILWQTPHFNLNLSPVQQITFKTIACIIFALNWIAIERHNYERDLG